MKRLLLLALVAACTHDFDRTLDLAIAERMKRAAGELERANLDGAGEIYDEILAIQPHRGAAAGRGLVDFFSVFTSDPIIGFLDRCNQPRFDVVQSIFGPDGLLAKEDRADLGIAELETLYRPDSATADATIPWNAPAVRTEVVTAFRDTYEYRELRVTVSVLEPRFRTLELQLNVDDIFEGDGVATPLVAPLEIPLAGIDGALSIHETIGPAAEPSEVPVSGRVRIEAFGDGAGDPVVVQLIDATVPSFCTSLPCTARYLIRGRIADEVSVVEIPAEEIPFAQTAGLADAVERCGPLDGDFISAQLRALGDELAGQADHFRTAASGELTLALPKGLLHVGRDLPFNEADAAALESVLSAAAAALEFVSRYRLYDGDLRGLIETFTRDFVQVRDFEPARTAANLNLHLFAPRPDFDLTVARDRVRRSLDAAHRALTAEDPGEGLFDFDNLAIRRLVEEYADLVRTLRDSLDSAGPLESAYAPGYRFHLARIFDDPPTAANAAARLGVEALFTVDAESYELELASEALTDWPSLFPGALTRPEPGAPEAWLFTDGALGSAFDRADDDWPHFVNPLVRQIIEPRF